MTLALPRPSARDVTLTAAVVLLGQLTTWLQLDSPDAFAGSRQLNAAVLALGALPLLWRRFAPVAVVAISATVLCLPSLVADLDATVLGQFVPLIVVTASCGYHATSRRALLGAGFAIAGMLAVSSTTPVLRTTTSLVFNTLVLLAPWAAARALRHREDRARGMGVALEQERAQREGLVAEAVERERAKIARDLHDIVAHGVSIMIVQVGGARMQLAGEPDLARRSLLHAEDAGRQALTDLRRMLDVLRAAPAASPEPRPGLRQLDALVEHMQQAGLEVRVSATGDLGRLPAAIDISAYRIVQEALTNVIRHSDAGRADLRVEVGDKVLTVSVRDVGGRREDGDGGGHGVIGIRERVAFLDGHTRIGPDGSGGWEVAVRIPLSTVGDPASVVGTTRS